MATKDIFNFIEINERLATGGQPTEDQLGDAKADGYSAVINLAPHDPENFALPEEEKIVGALGMDYVHIPMPFDDPRPEHYQAFCDAMDRLNGQKVLVHCAANYRVSAVVSSWATQNLGWSEEEADALVKRIWESNPEYSMDEVWRAFIDTARG